MSRKLFIIGLLILSLSAFRGASLTHAATFDVDMGKMAPPCGGAGPSDVGFVDCTTNTGGYLQIAMSNLNTGDTVRWTNRTGSATPHTTTSEAALNAGNPGACATADTWDSGVVNAFEGGFVFTHTFTTPGTCTYFCIVHPAVMQGQVNVAAVSTTTISTSTTTSTTTTTMTTSTTTTTTTTTASTTTTTTCNDQNNGQGKDKGKGQNKGRCKGHGKDN